MNYQKLCKSLIAEIRVLRSENASINDAMYDSQERLERRNEQLRAERDRLDNEKRQMELDNWYKESERETLMKKLDRAESYGDEWGASRIKRQLKNL